MPVRLVRVLVLDASATRRARLERLLQGDSSLQVVGVAGTAQQATELAQRKLADVILIGLAAAPAQAVAWVRHIMHVRPLPIVAVSAARPTEVQQQAFVLMDAGAIAVLPEPPGAAAAGSEEHAALLQTLRLMAEVKVVRRWAPPPEAAGNLPPPRPPARPRAAPIATPGVAGGADVVAIGASTGGPVALRQVLCTLPATFPVPILVVQHIAGGFVGGLASWLSASCSIRTEVASAGTKPEPGRAYIAPDGMHMRLGATGRLEFEGAAPVNGHRPSVSCLFASVAAHCAPRAIGILLTGMGKDGAAELKLLKERGAVTIAQDQASSVIHGMPGEAIRSGGATYVMSPEEIAAALPALAGK